jgi:beta-galactosidase
MNKAHLEEGKFGNALSLSGHDDWVEVYRDPALDVAGNQLAISFWVCPEPWNGHAYFITKSDRQYGLIQPDGSNLEFYIHTNRKYSVKTRVPDDWIHTWHHVAGIYDGEKLKIYVDGKLTGEEPCNGNILDGPYSVNIGKSSEIIDSHRGYMCHAKIDKVRIFNTPVPIEKLFEDRPDLLSESLLWLDFEETRQNGTYYSIGIPGRTYGLVWPDRSVQPELWQLKKTPQPVHVKAENLETGEFTVLNRHHFRNLNELDATWSISADNKILQQGSLDLDIDPQTKKSIRIPYRKPEIRPGTYYYLLVGFALPEKTDWAEKGHEIAWEQFKLPYYKPPESRAYGTVTPLSIERTESVVVIRGDDFTYTFNRNSGLLESMKYRGVEMIKTGPVFNVWRPPLANELDAWGAGRSDMGHMKPGMGRNLSNGWRSIGLDKLAHNLEHFKVVQVNETLVELQASYSVSSVKYTTGFDVSYTYVILGDGEVNMKVKTSPHGNMTHWLPKVGLQMQLPDAFQEMKWFGRGPFETYPDRKTGARTGIYESTVEKAYVPYIIPQDHGNRTDVHWVSMTNADGIGLFVTGDKLFNFSAQKYDTDNLSRAYYAFQLKDSDGVTLNLDHKTSGVGGTAISVLNKYRVLPKTYKFSFSIKPYSADEITPVELGKIE